MAERPTPEPRPAQSRLARWLLAGLGVLCVGLGAVGVFVPGLPTTVFLIAASWCFARSCPWLEVRLLRVPLFAPFLGFLEPGARMSRRTVAKALFIMWAAIIASAAAVGLGDDGRPGVAAAVIGLGLVGSPLVASRGEPRAGSRPGDRA
ncbi:MAG TPA: YbaN family protein [Thermoanaerobaculales bacterium]|nr:YbaN family protein [Thermoanaerobaculales bacterium]HPA81713.1 YbaN family protein [Thermoanaerobaculales bacterium]HQL29516.1 YbaN family protein [Thermoanaerobaculales bacterium]HQN95918.1 YbaN family protein [Thermoanaerobaculales bacterium]HQP42830.1 YbaN family protein [Thermoanaerobaculales bacterium]